ncbi:hypothetical protein [Saccharomonospora cyanea]|uniref:Uncharacterized protein n=1 Tax=Saccharomonospora cyanea NA-134 TaxID=882082 RepID=H5XMR2_9PSEU|nr:hypothetical protein [Saccharomonospora cyanea]EHR61041.1 hypothetical protein SaccyDRAFT_2152 [Saccharomonospora cyanea NA-134]
MGKEDRLAMVESLLALPFPGTHTQEKDRSGGPGYHVCVLQASQDFWDDRSEETVEAAREEVEATFQTLVTALTARWGGPKPIDLERYLWSQSLAPEPMNQLCQLSGEMLVWWRPEVDRWIGLAVGQGDPEFPIELLVAVGEASIPLT